MPLHKKLEQRLDVNRSIPYSVHCHASVDVMNLIDRHQRGALSCAISQLQFMELLLFFQPDSLVLSNHSGILQNDDAKRPAEHVPLEHMLKRISSLQAKIYNLTERHGNDIQKIVKAVDTFHKNLRAVYTEFKVGKDFRRDLKEQHVNAYIQVVVERHRSETGGPDNLPTDQRVQNFQEAILREYGGFLIPPSLRTTSPNWDLPTASTSDYSYMCDTLVEQMGKGMQGWKVLKYLGGGSFGTVLLMLSKGGRRLAVKFVKERREGETREEVRAQVVFSRCGLAPAVLKHKVLTLTSGEHVHVIIMEPVEMTLQQRLCLAKDDEDAVHRIARDVYNVLRRMHDNGLTHGDMHNKNFAYRYDKHGRLNPVLIDFGQASIHFRQPEMDVEQLMRILTDFRRPYQFGDIFADEMDQFFEDIKRDYTIVGTETQWLAKHAKYMKQRRVALGRPFTREIQRQPDIQGMWSKSEAQLGPPRLHPRAGAGAGAAAGAGAGAAAEAEVVGDKRARGASPSVEYISPPDPQRPRR